MSKKIISSVGITLMIIASIIAIMFVNVESYDFRIIGDGGSYANNFANDNNIEFEEVYTSNKDEYRYEVQILNYRLIKDEYEVNNYEGISDIIVIPNTYQNRKVVSINQEFLKNNTNVKKIVIQSNIKSLDQYILDNYQIECYNNEYCLSLDKEKYKNVSIVDQINYNYINSYMPFEFNIENNIVTLKKYIGTNRDIVVPVKYNGMDVKNIDFKLDELDIDSIYVSDGIDTLVVNDNFDYSIVFVLLLNILSLLVFIIFMTRINNRDLTEVFNNTKRYSLILVTLIINLVLSIMVMLDYINIIIYMVIFVIILVLEIMLFSMFSKVKKKIETYDNKVKNINNYKNELLLIIKNKDNIKIDLSELEEVIKYSDPVSIDEVKELEEKIKNEINLINENTIKEEVDNIIKLVRNRNDIIKNLK